jgi:type II secretory pathway pseudopilin PulG
VTPARRTRGGFTLLEVLAVVFLTSVVIGLALDFYVDLSRSTSRAAATTAGIRRATAILDRVARDFEHTLLKRKEPEADPLYHPWVFLAESRASELGADHVKFQTLSHVAHGSGVRQSNLATVAYLTRSDPDAGVELLRWTTPQPQGRQEDFPLPEDEGVLLLADGLADFGVRFLGADGEWTDRWDSSQLLDSSEIPLAVEIEVALFNDEGFYGAEEVARFSRRVLLPVRPIDPADLGGEPAEGELPEGVLPEGLDLPPEAEALLTPEVREALRREAANPTQSPPRPDGAQRGFPRARRPRRPR